MPTTEEQLNLILERLEKVERIINPPIWKIILKWIFHNFFTLVLLVFIAIIVWKVWGIVQEIIVVTEGLQTHFETFKNITSEAIEKLKFW